VTDSAATVLVIDDDGSVRRALERLLRSAGYRVRTFATGREFLEHDPLEDVGCVVLDVRMPGQGGLDLYEVLAQTGRDLSVVFITGHGDIPMAVKAIRAGAVDFLSKPLDADALLDAVDRAVARARQRRDLEAPRPSRPAAHP
jgi:FixJ family two-component response regulator